MTNQPLDDVLVAHMRNLNPIARLSTYLEALERGRARLENDTNALHWIDTPGATDYLRLTRLSMFVLGMRFVYGSPELAAAVFAFYEHPHLDNLDPAPPLDPHEFDTLAQLLPLEDLR